VNLGSHIQSRGAKGHQIPSFVLFVSFVVAKSRLHSIPLWNVTDQPRRRIIDFDKTPDFAAQLQPMFTHSLCHEFRWRVSKQGQQVRQVTRR
jgi:hypothetical protein